MEVCGAVSATIDMIEPKLEPELKEKVYACVRTYSSPKTCGAQFGYLLSRIWNAIKSIFGCSDWQLTRKAWVQDYAIAVIKTNSMIRARMQSTQEAGNAVKEMKDFFDTMTKSTSQMFDMLTKKLVEWNEQQYAEIPQDQKAAAKTIVDGIRKLVTLEL